VSEPDAPAAVEVIDVYKTFDRGVVRALDGVNLTIRRGEFVAITGPSGCGKSTLLHLLAALDHPTSGRVVVNGVEITDGGHLDRFRRSQIGLVFQFHDLLPHLSAAQNVEIPMFGTRRDRKERRSRALELLAEVDMAHQGKRRPTELSGGERQRVAIARALANEPALLLADEPTGSLDSASVERVLSLFRQLRVDRGVTIMMVTHDPAVAAAADRVVRMADGRILTPASQLT
jgi:putative ABC transport system ATP-binding protein